MRWGILFLVGVFFISFTIVGAATTNDYYDWSGTCDSFCTGMGGSAVGAGRVFLVEEGGSESVDCPDLSCPKNYKYFYNGAVSVKDCQATSCHCWLPEFQYEKFGCGYYVWTMCRCLQPTCISHATSTCYNNDVYWYDSCGVREEKRTECGANGCSGGSCIICTSHATSTCYDNDVYWYDSCDSREEKKTECGTSTYSGSDYCHDNDVYKNYITNGCSGESCTSSTDKIKQDECGVDGCSGGSCVNVYWTNMNGDKISEADFGDTIRVVMTDTSFVGDFNIFEEDGLFDDPIKTITGNIIDGNLVAEWTIKQEDLDKTSDYDGFRFVVDGEMSEKLKINLIGSDSPMSIAISSPNCGLHFDEGENVEIIIDASDEDDIINGTISISGNIIGSFSNGGVVFNKVFDSPGNSQIIAEGTNSRGDRARAISSIMILDKDGGSYVDGQYIAACILKPKDFSYMDESLVEFDASTTRAVKVTNGVLDLLIPDEGDTFSWYWRFMPENIVREFVSVSNPSAYRFTAEFPIAGDNSASLRVEID